MHETCPTVKVQSDNGQGFIVINEADFDAEAHELFGAEASDEEAIEGDAPKRRGRPPKAAPE